MGTEFEPLIIQVQFSRYDFLPWHCICTWQAEMAEFDLCFEILTKPKTF